MTAFRIITSTLIPVLLANLFYILDTKTKFAKLSVLKRQIIIGTVFGVFACLATQYGVPYDGYVLNVRSALPLTAGLIFGGPAGIIAGVMGAAYRWFSVYWGIPAYTRLACTIATLLAGIIATLCRKFLFSNKKTSWLYGMFIAIATEVFHMLLVFVTHPDDLTTAFTIVKNTAVLMISANAVSVLLGLLFVAMISKEKIHRTKLSRPMTQTFSVYLMLCILISFVMTSYFTNKLEKNVTDMQTRHLFEINISDVEADIRSATDKDLLSRTESITERIEAEAMNLSERELSEFLEKCAEIYNVTEINIVGEDGIISHSTNPDFIGFDMNTKGQAGEFLCLLSGEKTYVQNYGPMDYDKNVFRKYAGQALSGGGFVQIGYDSEHFSDTVSEIVSEAAVYRHIGQTGFIFIISDTTKEVVSSPADTVTTEMIAPFVDELIEDHTDDGITVASSGEYLYATLCVESFTVVGIMPQEEVEFSRSMSVYISAFMQLVVFFILFVVVYVLIKKIIVDNIHKINCSLAKITGGDLSTTVDIYENEEFSSLSNDINATVERLKGFISDAEKRIDMELAFAKSIQHSVLPSVFPAYPDRDDFDIYATMDTAKEVGGDFYDFYLLDKTHLVFLIADVSGKGIPAAMFMMNAKSVIKNRAESGLSPAEVLTEANERLCATNEAEMFVTVWIGIIDLATGQVKYANAGHNPPLVRHSNGSFEFLRTRPGLVLAGMDGIHYREGEFTLNKGDEIFLYTDGVTEATNKENELFGEERLTGILNSSVYNSSEEVCRDVKTALDSFVGEADQFDDITMLSFRFGKEKDDTKTITVPAVVESITTATDFVDGVLEEADCSPKALMQINVAIDEILSNIVFYAYKGGTGDAEVSVKISDRTAEISFSDSGIPFNPLENEAPDITESADDREIGGLGIFMVKKTMDEVRYEYRNEKNMLTIMKKI